MLKRAINKMRRTWNAALVARVRDIRAPEILAHESPEKTIRPHAKTILYVGKEYDYNDPGRGLSYEHLHFYGTLAESDYSLIYVPYDKLKRRYGRKTMSQILRQAFFIYQPDFLLYYHYLDWIDHPVWKEASTELPVKTIIMLGDDDWRYEETRSVWELFNVVVTTDKGMYEKRNAEGRTNVFLSQWGVNPRIYKNFGIERTDDVVFIGQAYGERPEFIRSLRERGVPIKTFGRGWPGSERLSQADVVERYNRAKIVFNSYINSKGNLVLNGRDFEAAACGSMVVTQDFEDMRSFFTAGKEVVAYHDIDDAAKKITHYLTHDGERKLIARAGEKRVLEEHTYEKRFEDILRFVESIQI